MDTRADLSPYAHFIYNPFEVLDASRDPHLFEYILVPKTADIARELIPAVVYAATGGGKTALRLDTERDKLDISGINFTLTYIPTPEEPLTQFADHQRGMLEALAYETLLRICIYPAVYLNLPASTKNDLARFLKTCLTVSLAYLVDSVVDIESRHPGKDIADYWNRPFYPERLGRFSRSDSLAALKDILTLWDAQPVSSARDWSFIEMMLMVMGAFGARNAFLLYDGIDNSAEGIRDPEQAARWIFPVFEQSSQWAQKNIYLKAFLTTDAQPFMEALLAERRIDIPAAHLQWDVPLLVQVIRYRVLAATGRRFASLDAISSLDVREIEFELARQLPADRLRPREIILLAHLTMQNALQRRESGYLTRQDLHKAVEQYFQIPTRERAG